MLDARQAGANACSGEYASKWSSSMTERRFTDEVNVSFAAVSEQHRWWCAHTESDEGTE